MPSSTISTPSSRSLLVIAHPGHELFVHGWLVQNHPLVLVLTDGSGVGNNSRLACTARNLRQANCECGTLFGRFTDRGFYQALLMKDHDRFVALAYELADLIIDEKITTVVGEAPERFCPASDVTRMLIDTAIGLLARERPSMKSYDFYLRPSRRAEFPRNWPRHTVLLREDRCKQKYQAMLRYPELQSFVETMPDQDDSWKRETLIMSNPWAILGQEASPIEYSDKIGSNATGLLPSIRFEEHIVPLGEALRLCASRGRTWAA
jgi:hypothetical protein